MITVLHFLPKLGLATSHAGEVRDRQTAATLNTNWKKIGGGLGLLKDAIQAFVCTD
jgi:hypothetical protein